MTIRVMKRVNDFKGCIKQSRQVLAEQDVYMGLKARKSVFGGLGTTKVQTSLHIQAVCSAPLLFAYWKGSYLNLLQMHFQ